MATLSAIRHRFYKNDGSLNAGGKVYTYVPGTSTLRNTYTDSTAGTPNTNPIILDSKGEADIWQTAKIKVNVLQSDDVQVTGFPVDDVGYLIIADEIHTATNKTTPVDADEVGIWDSISEALRRVSFANLWAWIQSKLAAPGAIGGTTPAAGSFTTLTSTGGAFNGTVGATTPGTVAATTISGTTGTFSGALSATSGTFTGALTTSSTSGLGYAVGAGTTVTQLTSKSTSVSITFAPCIRITTHNAALAANTAVSFTVSGTVTFSFVGYASVRSGEATPGSYAINVYPASAGAASFVVSIRNLTGGSLSEAIVFDIMLFKSTTA